MKDFENNEEGYEEKGKQFKKIFEEIGEQPLENIMVPQAEYILDRLKEDKDCDL